MVDQSRDRPHIYLPDSGESENYTSPRTGTTPPPPPRDRERHANELARAIGQALLKARQQLDSREPEIATGKPGFYLEFQVLADQANAFEKLENRQNKIELVAVHKPAEQEDVVKATVFVPEASTDYFLSKVEQYRDQETKKGKPKNEALVTRLETVEIGTVRSLFTDDSTLFPQDGQEVWWEVWLRRDQRETFNTITERLNIQTKPHAISFPEREVVLAMADVEAMARLIKNSDAVAELRIAKDTPSMFLDMGQIEQERWVTDVADRILEPGQHAIALCLLDSGVTRTHPLIEPALDSSDMHTYEPSWGVHDNWGHGTQMAGLALYSDLLDVLQTSNQVKLRHRLESVKILQSHQPNDPELYGAITQEAVARPEIQAPTRRRVFCMAITSEIPASNQGTPSSWSAAIDQLCFGEDDWRRLMVISVGNIRQDMMATDYLDLNDVSPIENPGQAWNPLIVGAYTEKINIIDPTYVGWQAVAPGGDLSPRSRTSVAWNSQWPIRPDVVFEGGNLASDGENPAIAIDDLCLLTTDYRPNLRLFNSMRDTSCATALASYMAARIMSEKPTYIPETIRALIVHSAEWTPAMQRRFQAATTQKAKHPLLRRYGYGVPNLERALQSANNDLTLIIEDELQPFYLENNSIKTREMKLHSLPWPHEELERLGEANVELKVTLSYFIEPNPGERGWGQRHRYASYSLRFEVKRSLESHDDFRKRINKAAREEEENTTTRTESDNWFLGSKLRNRGSIHSDIWYGTAVELAQRSAIAVYPVGGWWKDKKYLERWQQSAGYSLIVSIRVPEVEVDIYTPVLNRVKLAIDINT